MTAARPSSSIAAPPAVPMSGADTKTMLVLFEQDLLKVSPNVKVNKNILVNAQLYAMQNKINDLKENRESIYRVQAEVALLRDSLGENNTIKVDTKNQIKEQLNGLTNLVDLGIQSNDSFTKLKVKLDELEAEHNARKKAYYSAIEKDPATPKMNNEDIIQKIEEHTKEVDQLAKTFIVQHQQLVNAYAATRASLPMSLSLKSLSVLIAPTPEAEIQRPQLE